MFSGHVFGPLEPVRDVARTAWLDSGPNSPPLAAGGGADRALFRQRPYRRITGDRRRSAALGAYLSGCPACEPVAVIGGARGDGGARARSGGGQRSAPPTEPSGTGLKTDSA